jgi:hypothetical protein
MGRSRLTDDYPFEMVRLACRKRPRKGQYGKKSLIDRSARIRTWSTDLRLMLAEGCPKIAANQMMDLCGVFYSDAIGK